MDIPKKWTDGHFLGIAYSQQASAKYSELYSIIKIVFVSLRIYLNLSGSRMTGQISPQRNQATIYESLIHYFMVKFPVCTTLLAMVCVSFSAWATPPAASDSEQGNARTRLIAVDRSSSDAPRRLPVPVTASRITYLPISTPSQATYVSQRARRAHSPLVLRQAAGGIDLRGTVLESTAWGATKAYGVYQIPTVAGEEFSLIGSSPVPLTEGYDDGNGTYYSAYMTSSWGQVESCHLAALNTSDWSLIYDDVLTNDGRPDCSMYAFGSAEDPTTGEVYACCSNLAYNGWNWVKIDYPSKSLTIITPELEIAYAAVGCDDKGQFYGITEFGRFVKIDKSNGTYTEYPSGGTFPASVGLGQQHGGCVDNANGRFLVSTYDPYSSTGALHSFDLKTGEYTKLLDFPNGEQVLGLYIPATPPAPQAPAAAGLSVTCENGAMEAIVKITMPTTLNDGSDATGQTFNYSLSANGTSLKEGQATAGDEVAENIPMNISGVVHFTVILSNSNGESPKTRASCYIGKGTPSMPANVVLSHSGNTATLSWDAVTTTSDGGYINPADVTYMIRDAAGETIKSGISATSESFTVEVPATGVEILTYSVASVYDSKTSGWATSNQLMLGSYAVPMTMTFDDVTFPQHTVIDANKDGKTWMLNFGKAMIAYSVTLTMDDWLISPPIALEANKTYPFKARVQAFDSYSPERIEVKAGMGTTADAMTIEVVAPTIVEDTSYEGVEISGNIVTGEAGNYHIGFHGISDPYMYNLYIISYEISASLSGENPVAVNDLVVTPDATGALTAEVAFTTPATNINNAEITEALDVVVTRNGETEVYHKSVAAGQPVSFPDEVPEAGTYTYTVTAAVGTNVSTPATSEVYIGPKPAAMVEKVTVWQTANDKAHLSWTAVTTDIDGKEIPAADVTYEVYAVGVNENNNLVLGEKITTLSETSYDAEVAPSEQQDYLYFAVKSCNRGVGQTDLRTGNTVFGNAYPVPHRITNETDTKENFFEGWTSDYYYVQIMPGSSKNGVPAQDGDDSYISIKTPYTEQSAYIATGRISLAGVTDPALIFWMYGFELENGDLNTTTVSVICDGEEKEIDVIDHSDLFANRWNRIYVNLSEFAGKVVRVKLLTYCNGTQYSLYDNIYIGQNINNDLRVSIDAPNKAKSGTPFSINVTVNNDGGTAASNVDVNLLRDGEMIATRQVASLPAEEATQVVFDQVFSPHDAVSYNYTAEVVYAADEMPDNNVSSAATVSRIVNKGPIVTALHGENTPEGNLLTWDAVITGVASPEIVAESFEEAESWTQEAEGWLLIDVDDSPVGGFTTLTIPGVTQGVTKSSFFVWDNKEVVEDSRYAAHTGDKCLASLFREDYGTVDDWAVSPRLDGKKQTIKFFAKSYSGAYPERMEILYTSGEAADREAYTSVQAGEVPGEWTEYSFTVPEGTTHFAIRSNATWAYILLLDDFTFSADNGFYNSLLGYNIYCDRVLLNNAPVTETTFTHTNPGEVHTYHVTAVYDNGESELSEPLVIARSSVDAITSDGLSIRVDGQTIIVSGTAGACVTLSGMDGKTYHSANGDCRLTVAPAAYLLTVGTTVRKLIVR